jgi:hypothetical protein
MRMAFSCISFVACLFLATSEAQDGVVNLQCAASDCQGCLGMGCDWSPGGSICVVSCDYLSHSECYSFRYFPEIGANVTALCDIAEQDKLNSDLCSQFDTCSDCVGASQLNGESCEWFDFGGYCGRGVCNQLGCGSVICATDAAFAYFPSEFPSDNQSDSPSDSPSDQPSDRPSDRPSDTPIDAPSSESSDDPPRLPPASRGRKLRRP